MRIIIKLLLVMFVIGLVLSVAAFFMGLDIKGLSEFFNDDESYGEEIVYTQTDMIEGIELMSETRDVTLSVTDDASMTIRYHAHERDTWTLVETDGVLSIIQDETFEFFSFVKFKVVSPEIRTIFIEVPRAWELDLSIQSNVGTIRIEFEDVMTHGALSIESNTGKVYLKNLDVTSVDVELDTGTTSMINVTIENDLSVNTHTGTVYIENLIAQDVVVSSDTGNIRFNGMQANEVVANNDTGRVTAEQVVATGDIVFKTTTGRITVEDTIATAFDLRASTGDIIVELESLSDMRYDLKSTVGNIEVNGANQGTSHITTSGSIPIFARVTTGNIKINVQD